MMYSTKSIVDYPSALKFLYSLNARINKKGVSAPSYQSLEIVATLYKKLGKPLDKIPIVHIGGTNGKVG
jgi:folylpolyglutamate synthase/dihydropteroate synthase